MNSLPSQPSPRQIVEDCIAARGDLQSAARKLYLSYPTFALRDDQEMEFLIKDKIRVHFGVGFHCIQIAGSAKTGYSFHKKTEFSHETSDLDVAIIDASLFLTLCEYVILITKNYSNLGQFGRTRSGIGHDILLRNSISEFGMIHLSLLPNSQKKSLYQRFLWTLSKEYNRLFKDINVAVYASSFLFEAKLRTDLSRALGDAS